MPHDPDRHHRQSTRLRGYDYTRAGAYFVTVCAQDRECRFGAIVDGCMQANAAGEMVIAAWLDLPARFPSLQLDAWVLMPNHWHGIVVLRAETTTASEPPTLGTVLGAFKSITTAAYARAVEAQRWPPFRARLWQRGFHDQCVRDDAALMRIRQYIANNPARWAMDSEHPESATLQNATPAL